MGGGGGGALDPFLGGQDPPAPPPPPPPPPFLLAGGIPKTSMRGGKGERVRTRMLCVLVLNSYPDPLPPFPKSCIGPCYLCLSYHTSKVILRILPHEENNPKGDNDIMMIGSTYFFE